MSIVLVGSTSGSITLQEPAVAGATVLNLPATSGTVALTSQIPSSVGKVLQVVTGTTTTTVTVSSATQTDTGLTATITPTSATSRILVLTSSRIFGPPDAPATVRLIRNSTTIQQMTRYGLTDNPAAGQGNQFVTTILDSPATTSATTYKIAFLRHSGGGTVFAQLDSDLSTITLMEIAA